MGDERKKWKWVCPLCGQPIEKYQGLIVHIKHCFWKHISIAAKHGYICPCCGHPFATEKKLTMHAVSFIERDPCHLLLAMALMRRKGRRTKVKRMYRYALKYFTREC